MRGETMAVILAGLAAIAACAAPDLPNPFETEVVSTATPPPPVATPAPAPSLLVVCLAQEPNTLYLYGAPNRSAQTLLPLIYDGPFDVVGYRIRPVILEAAPSVDSGTIRLEEVALVSGDLYFNPKTRLAEPLRPGKPYLPAGCTSPSCQREYQGGGAQLSRMVVEFRLVEDLIWSDGAPLTAHDSAFSYRLASDPGTPGLKDQVNRTAAYEAVDDRTVRWTGIPGFFDPEAETNFWTPLPQHLLGGIAAADLPVAEEASRRPIGWGPYRIESWRPGASIELVPNPSYRGAQGEAGFEQVLVRFLEEGGEAAIQQVLTGECDVLEESLVGLGDLGRLRGVAGDGRLQWLAAPGMLIERLDFGLQPVDGRPAILSAAATRRALASCIDRAALVAEVVPGLSPIFDSYVSPDHPLAIPADGAVPFSPGEGRQALTDLGWIDDDEDPRSPRRAQGVAGIPAGTPLALSLLTMSDGGHALLAEAVADDLGACGVDVEVETLSPEVLFATWPAGAAFGRTFDLVLWPWLQWITPACDVFTTGEIPSTGNPEGSNASGFSDRAFDDACARAELAPVDPDAYRQALETTQTIFAESLPGLPLLQWPRSFIASRFVCGLEVDATVASPLWNVEAWRPGPECGP